MENEVKMKGANLPEELIQEILVRLPVKPLLKFRCVSKSWLSLILSERFAKVHLKISTKNNACIHDTLIFGPAALPPMDMYTRSISSVIEGSNLADVVYSVYEKNSVYSYVHLGCPFLEQNRHRWLVGSCNGLVCLSFSYGGIILWNPITRKSKELPCPPTPTGLGSHYAVNHAFGYDEVHDDYKVVELAGVDGVSNSQVNVYSRRSNSWKVLTNWPGGDGSNWPGQFLNGAIHWSVQDYVRSLEWFVVVQDLATDVFVELPIPYFDDYDDVVGLKVQIIQGCVALCCGYNACMDVWLMKEYGVAGSWVKAVRIQYFLDLKGTDFNVPWPLFFFAGSKILINYGGSLRIYDSCNPQPYQFSYRFPDFKEVTAATFLESLVSPNLDETNPV